MRYEMKRKLKNPPHRIGTDFLVAAYLKLLQCDFPYSYAIRCRDFHQINSRIKILSADGVRFCFQIVEG